MSEKLGVSVQILPQAQEPKERDLVNGLFNFMNEAKNTTDWLLRPNIATKTASYTLNDTDYSILVDSTSDNVTINLPTATALLGRIVVVKRIDGSGNEAIVDADGTETIDGSLTQSLTQWDSLILQSDSSNWYKLN